MKFTSSLSLDCMSVCIVPVRILVSVQPQLSVSQSAACEDRTVGFDFQLVVHEGPSEPRAAERGETHARVGGGPVGRNGEAVDQSEVPFAGGRGSPLFSTTTDGPGVVVVVVMVVHGTQTATDLS